MKETCVTGNVFQQRTFQQMTYYYYYAPIIAFSMSRIKFHHKSFAMPRCLLANSILTLN